MSLDAIEDNTKVVTPAGHVGRVSVTRRERKLIDAKKLHMVNVEFINRPDKQYDIDDLTLVTNPVEYNICPCCGKEMD